MARPMKTQATNKPGAVKDLTQALRTMPTNCLFDDNQRVAIIDLLTSAWNSFDGGDATAMADDKLWRAEDMVWNPPVLSFKIERHGGTVNGSSRADVYEWGANLETLQADCEKVSYRQKRPNGKRLDTKKLAMEIAKQILGHQKTPYLEWLLPNRVRLRISQVITANNKQTAGSRRARLRRDLSAQLEQHGWHLMLNTTPNTFEKTTVP